jgi:hypothetical protein
LAPCDQMCGACQGAGVFQAYEGPHGALRLPLRLHPLIAPLLYQGVTQKLREVSVFQSGAVATSHSFLATLNSVAVDWPWFGANFSPGLSICSVLPGEHSQSG